MKASSLESRPMRGFVVEKGDGLLAVNRHLRGNGKSAPWGVATQAIWAAYQRDNGRMLGAAGIACIGGEDCLNRPSGARKSRWVKPSGFWESSFPLFG